MERKRPVFGCISFLLAGLSLVLPVVVVGIFAFGVTHPDRPNGGWDWLDRIFAGGEYGAVAAGVSALLGVASGVEARLRGERRPWLSALGLAVNGAILVLVVWGWVSPYLNPA